MVVVDSLHFRTLLGTCAINDLESTFVNYYYYREDDEPKKQYEDRILKSNLLNSQQVVCIIDSKLVSEDIKNVLVSLKPGIVGEVDQDSFKLSLEILNVNNCFIHKNVEIYNQFIS